MENLGTRLRKLRKDHGDTQQVLADIAGVTKQAISKIESKGVIESAGATLEPIARHYGVTVRWLTTGEGPKYLTEKPSQAARLDPEMLAESYAALSEIYEEELGRRYALELEPERFVLVYEARSSMSATLSAKEERIFTLKVSAIVRQAGVESHGQRNGVPAEGHDKGDVAGGVQRKKSRPKAS